MGVRSCGVVECVCVNERERERERERNKERKKNKEVRDGGKKKKKCGRGGGGKGRRQVKIRRQSIGIYTIDKNSSICTLRHVYAFTLMIRIPIFFLTRAATVIRSGTIIVGDDKSTTIRLWCHTSALLCVATLKELLCQF